jgi:hypothetical protein
MRNRTKRKRKTTAKTMAMMTRKPTRATRSEYALVWVSG